MRLLIISPHFPPVNAADMHRVRLLLPYWAKQGVEVEVLAVDPLNTGQPQDPWLSAGLPPGIRVHRVKGLGLGWRKIPGFGSLAFRVRRALADAGDALLAHGKFDMIYFSTTVFAIHPLGVRWKRMYGVPFVMDYQDPWVNDYYREHPQQRPPGGRLKHGIMDFLHRWMEPRVLKECAGITAVSPAYPEQLVRRYPWFGRLAVLVQPFPGDARDLERAGSEAISQSIYERSPDQIHWVYAGMVNEGMNPTFRAFFRALRDQASPELLRRLHLHFIGTRYAGEAGSAPLIRPLAAEYGLANNTHEIPQRVPYSEVLGCLRDADALLVFGSNDAGYTASKIYPYLLAGKPLLTIFHCESSVITLLQKVAGSVCVSFTGHESEESLAGRIGGAWLKRHQHEQILPLNETEFAPYTAAASAQALATFFKSILGHS